MIKDPLIYLEQIYEAVEIINKYTIGMKKTDFVRPSAVQDAVILRLEIIGEAARAVPEDFRIGHKEIPWRKIADFRNKLIHDYFGVDFDLVWNILQKDLPKLKKQIKEIIN
jgi:uncharacterized protein with HEPN domain